MGWIELAAGLAQPVFGGIDALIYTDQERARDGFNTDLLQLERDKLAFNESLIAFQSDQNRLNAAVSQKNNQALVLGLGVLGVLGLGALAVTQS